MDILSTLKSQFGYDEFRPPQEDIVRRTLDKKDSLIIMPTGGGKSLCYQLPAILMDGMALVISPLIALMKDQVESLKANGIEAGALNSSVDAGESRLLQEKIDRGILKILYISPERAVTEKFINFIQTKKISLIAVDEAHCVSVWGNDFRPEYTQLPQLITSFPEVPCLALTATADKATQKDIAYKLGLKNPQKFLSSFERKNIDIKVLPAFNRFSLILKIIERYRDESGIIYCLSRKSTVELATKLKNEGYSAAHYHAEVPAQERHKIQEDFQKDNIKIICATIAFGMGIDKSNIRYVIHYNLPKNIESYYQEIGRAGRDSLPAEAILFFNQSDAIIFKKFIDDSTADSQFKKVQTAKLYRLLDFCQATNCRTNMILSYFGEHRTEPCLHCDNCKSPPETFDGTTLAQMALSAVKRLNEKVATNMLTDVLRGATREDIFRMGFHKIKTYGAGKEVSRNDWLHYISQMVNLGIFEIDYTDYNKLKVTALGEKVLFEGLMVKLARQKDLENSKKAPPPVKGKSVDYEEALFSKLKALRHKIATEAGLPPYVIFHDSTLKEMAAEKPETQEELLAISGVGAHKLEKYGDLFINCVRDHSEKPA